MNSKLKILMLIATVGFSGAANAAQVLWTNWGDRTALGTISPLGVTVSYSGEVQSLISWYPSWEPVSTYSGGTIDNAPLQWGGIIWLDGGTSNLSTISFSTPVVNPVMAIWSLGDSVTQASFVFSDNQPFTIQSGGPDIVYGGSTILASGNTVYGSEAYGTIQFQGTYSQLTWTNPQYEHWSGFTVGAPVAVPIPAAVWLFGSGLLGLIGVARRRRVS
jgi:hypothetical protein